MNRSLDTAPDGVQDIPAVCALIRLRMDEVRAGNAGVYEVAGAVDALAKAVGELAASVTS